MPSISSALVPTISPGNLFTRFTEDTTLNIRWLTAGDPVFFEVQNRPMADITLRQLIIAKALDNINLSLGMQALFPFLINPQVSDGTSIVDVPVRVFWDMNVSVSTKWANLRLARIDRLDGANGTDAYSGTLRFIFTANERTGGVIGTSEVGIFYVDYEIDSDLTYQRIVVSPATASAVPNLTVMSTSDQSSVDGFVTFRTLDTTETENQNFLDLLEPAGSAAEYEIVDSAGLGSTSTEIDFSTTPVSHGTGMLTHSAFSVIIPVNNDPITWIDAFNYPFAIDATLEANDSSGMLIPGSMFREFDVTAPAGDAGTDDVTGTTYPVWINRIESDDAATDITLTFYLSTYGIDPVDPANPIEFGSFTLDENMIEGQIVPIIPVNDLFGNEAGADWQQHFGRGHVVLSSNWGVSGGNIANFFTDFPSLVGADSEVTFSLSGTRISSFGVSRVPKYTPTAGQSAALKGTSARRATAIDPGESNRYITEMDDGLGDLIDLDSQTGISPHAAIDRFGNEASLARKLVKLVVDSEAASDTEDPNFYTDEVLPRLRVLLGRDPEFGDVWYNGQRFMQFNGDSWVG